MQLLSVKIHRTQRETILAVCDLEILGGRFSDDEKRIEVYRSFYGERTIDESELLSYIQMATIVNLVGPRAVGKALELGYVDERRVLKIGDTVHAQIATMQK